MIVTNSQYQTFQDSFMHWYRKFGLNCYRVTFRKIQLDRNYAEIYIMEMGKSCTVNLTSSIDKIDVDTFNPVRLGLHEAIHLLTHRLKWLGDERYIMSSDITEEWESVVRRIQSVLE